MAKLETKKLESIAENAAVLVGGDAIATIPREIASKFRPGDKLAVVEETGEILLIAKAEREAASAAVKRAHDAFFGMGQVSDAAIARFYEAFAARLESEATWAIIAEANREDVAAAKALGRSTTRLVADEKLRRGMIEGLRGWMSTVSKRGQVLESVPHEGWKAELVGAALGVVAFVFEGRPNVLADATGVLRGGNTVVFRIGRDALRTARCIMQTAVVPALQEAGLPEGAVSLVDSAEHAAGWALFSDRRLALAVARGSGAAVATLGALARQAGIPVSLHGTGGAWIVASEKARPEQLEQAIYDSLDRKVCNTVNVCVIVESRAAELTTAMLRGLERAGERRKQNYKLHATELAKAALSAAILQKRVAIRRADGDHDEAQVDGIDESRLGHEWEWEDSPEMSFVVVPSLAHAIELFNRYSPQFVASLISDDASEHAYFYEQVNAPFVGDALTRWVDGQRALCKPELGLSNWQYGRLSGRGGILTGDGVFTIRTRYITVR